MFIRTLKFFETYDLLLCPTTIVAPFPVEERYVTHCNGTKFETYVDWLAIVSAITNVCCPAISIPAGFTTEQLPVGLQIIAPPRNEARLLSAAKLLEDVLGFTACVPIDPVQIRV
jgi:amidase